MQPSNKCQVHKSYFTISTDVHNQSFDQLLWGPLETQKLLMTMCIDSSHNFINAPVMLGEQNEIGSVTSKDLKFSSLIINNSYKQIHPIPDP